METNPPERKCPKCGGDMEVGFLRDRAHGGGSRAGEWIEGMPDLTWTGLVKLGSQNRFTVEAFRCERCGFLEQYAVGELRPSIFGS